VIATKRFGFALGIMVLCCAHGYARKWTDSTGKHSVEAEFLELAGQTVRLRRSDGEVINLPLERLSRFDQQYVQQVAQSSAEPGDWVSLFNGRDLTGWQPVRHIKPGMVRLLPRGGGWIVRDGQLVSDGAEAFFLRTDQRFSDFVLQLEFKIPAEADSGLAIRCRGAGFDGMEIQLLGKGDGADTRIDATKRTGAILRAAAPTVDVQRGSDQWNTLQIRCEGDNAEVHLNGTLIVQTNMQRVETLRNLSRSGFLGFLNSEGKARGTSFRNIRIRELGPIPIPISKRQPEPIPLPHPLPEAQFVELQEGDNLPKVRIQPKHPRELADNRIGDFFPMDRSTVFPTDTKPDYVVPRVIELGLKWVRLSLDRLDWSQVEEARLYSEFNVTRAQDKTITMLAENGVTIMCCICYWDESLHVGSNYPRYRKEHEIQRFLDYTRFIVQHFRGRIKYYELLNEPIHGHPQQNVELPDYINLIRRVAPVIRQEDPEARLVVGGPTDLRHSRCQDWMTGLLRSEAMPLVDVVSTHPMYGPSPQYAETREFYYGYASLVERMKREASDHGLKGEWMAEEMSWKTQPHPHEVSGYGATVAAKYYARCIVMHLGIDVWAGLGTVVERTGPKARVVQNLCTVMAGNKPASLQVQVRPQVKDFRDYSFSLPNGDRLVALWRDNIAENDDRGVPCTVIVRDVAARKVTGIDVLYSSEQQMMTDTEGGNLIIRNLLVKDYPIILRLTHVSESGQHRSSSAPPAAAADEESFVSLFDGRSLDGWHGDLTLWSVRNGVIVGSTDNKRIQQNSFLWTKIAYDDFVHKVKFKLRNGNSGIQFRSQQRDNHKVTGYQAEISEEPHRHVALWHEGSNRILCQTDPKRLAEHYREKDWNEYTITCKGRHITLAVNGHTTADYVEKSGQRTSGGIIALQLFNQKLPNMQVSFKDIRIKELTGE